MKNLRINVSKSGELPCELGWEFYTKSKPWTLSSFFEIVGSMIITRWQAPTFPSLEQAKIIFQSEGLEPMVQEFSPSEKVSEQKLPFGASRWIIEGEMLFNIGGNQFILRQGDRLEIPANTRHSFSVHGTGNCKTLSGYRIP